MSQIETWVEALKSAKVNRSPIPAFNLNQSVFSLDEAYKIQRKLRPQEPLLGFKMGLTSKAKQKDVGVDSPICGFLLRSMLEFSNVSTEARIHPRAEPEIVFELNAPVTRDSSAEEVRAAIGTTYLGLEILDSRYQDFKFKLPDVVADNTSASGVVVSKNPYVGNWDDLSLVPIVLKKNGETVATATPAAVLGHPFHALVELTKMLENDSLEAGMLVFTGGITKSVPFDPGDEISVESSWDTLGFKAV